MFEALKNALRVMEARFTPRTSALQFEGEELRFQRSLWWVNESQPCFDEEIVPYFEAIQRPSASIRTIVDAGAATGLFAVAACRRFPQAVVHCFEPSLRQGVLLRRNCRLNALGPNRVEIDESGLWDRETTLAFRTIGAMSSIEEVSHLAGALRFAERIPVSTLDLWNARRQPGSVDLVKMDIEGAEIEALRGAVELLRQHRPELLIMAYHDRGGTRAFERCAEFLETHQYTCCEVPGVSGFLHATPR